MDEKEAPSLVKQLQRIKKTISLVAIDELLRKLAS